jgi:Tfp pilus assembly protein PilN
MTPRMNLVPKAFQRKLLVRKRIRQWFPPCAVALCISVAAVGEVGYRLRTLSVEAANLDARLQPMNEMSRKADEVAARLKSLVGHESVLHEIAGVQRPISLLAVISQSAGQSNSRLQIRKLTVQQASTEAAAKEPATTSTEITIHGVAVDDADVAAFVQSLKSSQSFSTVELKSTTSTVVADVAVRQYDVSCRR